MLYVKTPEEVLEIIQHDFFPIAEVEWLPFSTALGRILAEDLYACEYVPDFNRSAVDGYAVRAADTFGCTEAIPAILQIAGEIVMGKQANALLSEGSCYAIPTGGAVPDGADSVVMIEYTEDYGDGTIGISKAAAPGENMIFRGDDVYPGKLLLSKGRVLRPQDIGALAAIGQTTVPVYKKLTVGIISTGDELIPPENQPEVGQMRDVNGPMLEAMLANFGVQTIYYGIVADDEALLTNRLIQAVQECDMILLSGGSSVGAKDAACRVIASMGRLLLHGIAIKPGKPTILGKVHDKPVYGLPGHPVAAYFITRLFVLPTLARLMGRTVQTFPVTATLAEQISANQGRAQYHCCRLKYENDRLVAYPVRGKSGLITTLAGTDGYFCIDRDCEGLPQGAEIQVFVDTGI